MQIQNCHLTYCLNVHNANNIDEISLAIKEYSLKIKNQICPDQPFGLGLYLSNKASIELEKPNNLNRFKEFLIKHNLYCFTINAFPYGDFFTPNLKTKVYYPDWTSSERLQYSKRVCNIMAELLPDNINGSISSIPISYKTNNNSWDKIKQSKKKLNDIALFLQHIELKTGKHIDIAIEPEPDCCIETSQEFIDFYQQLNNITQQYIGLCFDTCHLAIQYENLTQSLLNLHAANIPINKIQISSALRIDKNFQQNLLHEFYDDKYLHQVKIKTNKNILSFSDLSPDIMQQNTDLWQEMRIHFHLPIYFNGYDNIKTTNNQIDLDFFKTALKIGVKHFEIETYTFNVLPTNLQNIGLTKSIINEYYFAMEKINAI